jgi:hypothetical protein
VRDLSSLSIAVEHVQHQFIYSIFSNGSFLELLGASALRIPAFKMPLLHHENYADVYFYTKM